MKPHTLLTVCLVLLCPALFAQPGLNDRTEQQQKRFPAITKGYYSIYRNAEKLRLPGESSPHGRIYSTRIVTKGYYSIAENTGDIFYRKVTPQKGYYGSSVTFPARKISKGYYSIGRNFEKLNKTQPGAEYSSTAE